MLLQLTGNASDEKKLYSDENARTDNAGNGQCPLLPFSQLHFLLQAISSLALSRHLIFHLLQCLTARPVFKLFCNW